MVITAAIILAITFVILSDRIMVTSGYIEAQDLIKFRQHQ